MELCNIGKFFCYFALYESCCSYQLCRNIKKGIWIDINQWNMLWWLNDRSVKGLPDFQEFGGSLAQTVSFMLSAVCLFAWWCSCATDFVMKLFYLGIDRGTNWSFCDFYLNFSGTVCTSFQEIKSLPVIVLPSCILYRCTGTHLLLSVILWTEINVVKSLS